MTYNLFLTARSDLQTGCQPSLDASQLPFSQLLKTAIADLRFLFKGGKIGVYLTHRYPHTHPQMSKLLPACLKVLTCRFTRAPAALG